MDTAPTIHRGLCLFGCKSGWVYCLRADDGRLIWRLRAAPLDERIVAYGQIESPWPVPGSVLVVDDVAYFAAGRQPLADGGILVFAVEPALRPRPLGAADGQRAATEVLRFQRAGVRQLRSAPTRRRRRSHVAMVVRPRDGQDDVPGEGGLRPVGHRRLRRDVPAGLLVLCRRGTKPRQLAGAAVCRPLAVFRDNTLYGCSQDRRTLLRRDFHLDAGEKFDADWFSGWTTYSRGRVQSAATFEVKRVAGRDVDRGMPWSPLSKNSVSAMILAGDALYLAGSQGGLVGLDTKDGRGLGQLEVPPPVWDGMAAAERHLVLSTRDGHVICLGENRR